MKKELVNEFSWSVSRAQLFRQCRRAYYYNYYGSWGGWNPDAPKPVRKMYILKNLKNLALWGGSIVHDTVRDALMYYRDGASEFPTVEQLQARARQTLRNGWTEAVSRQWEKTPKATNLFELYYGNGRTLPAEQTSRLKEVVYDALDNFRHSGVLKEILAVPMNDWLTVDKLTSFQVDGTKVWCALDFAWRDTDGNVQIIDWKTGGEHSENLRQQLGCYGLYAMEAWKVGAEQIKPSGVFLNDGGRRSHYSVDATLLFNVKEQILQSIQNMRSCLKDKDNNVAEEEDFPFTDSPDNCLTCPFREICPACGKD
ncbi:MAG: PD-(D/E)XK nuclease family protein [Victivallales bacterium]|nr:PD-(D/E)XK nuclease family protein [Victivallales bacterium]